MRPERSFRQSSNQPAQKKANNMQDWAIAIDKLGLPPEGLAEDREIGWNNLEKLGLPTWKKIQIDFAELTKNPQLIDKIDSPTISFNLLPNQPNLQRHGMANVPKDRAMDRILQLVPRDLRQYYTVNLQEFYENKLGGNLIISPDGNLFGEFHPGMQGPVARGQVTPSGKIERDRFLDSLKYTFDRDIHDETPQRDRDNLNKLEEYSEQDIKSALYHMLLTIPHSNEGRELTFHPGYYEFTLVDRKQEGILEPIFLDYRDNESYTLPVEEKIFDPASDTEHEL